MTKFARQVDYDHLVNDFVAQGASWEEAVVEANGTFVEGGYDLNGLFQYNSRQEYDQKTKAENYLRMFDQLLLAGDASVNLVFGLQGLTQNIQSRSSEVIRIGTLRLIEQRGTFQTLLKVLAHLSSEVEGEEILDRSDGEDEDEDEDESKILQKQHLANFLQCLVDYPSDQYLNYSNFTMLNEENIPMLRTVLDADCGEARLMEPYCNILHMLLRTDSNRELLRETSLVPELTVAKKMLKNNNAIQQKIDRILAITA